jgi:hypothetical protein
MDLKLAGQIVVTGGTSGSGRVTARLLPTKARTSLIAVASRVDCKSPCRCSERLPRRLRRNAIALLAEGFSFDDPYPLPPDMTSFLPAYLADGTLPSHDFVVSARGASNQLVHGTVATR